jgi:prephenate dehydratase
MRAAFQGIHGAYSEVAARQILGADCVTLPCDSFKEVFQTVESGRAQAGVIPIENSLAGSIHENYDLLLSHRLHIVGETHLRIEHVLMAHPSTSLRRILEVRSHPQALAQCSRFFARHRRLRPAPYFDTAGAAKSIMDERNLEVGAIASALAASLYHLRVLKRNVENHPTNYTRFLIIKRTPWRPHGGVPVKSSIAFAPAINQVGILFRILGVFSLRDIDLMKIESRPDPYSPFEYLFYIDLRGNPAERRVARALEHLQEMVSWCRILGTYPVGKGSFPRGASA